jgi:hypothetical protein
MFLFFVALVLGWGLRLLLQSVWFRILATSGNMAAQPAMQGETDFLMPAPLLALPPAFPHMWQSVLGAWPSVPQKSDDGMRQWISEILFTPSPSSLFIYLYIYVIYFAVVLGIKLGVSHMLGKCSTWAVSKFLKM